MGERLAGKVCCITGAGKGIGAATAALFVREGAMVEIGDLDEAALADTVQALHQISADHCYASVVDVTDATSVQVWKDAVISRHERVDVLFNNAGISAVGALHEITRQQWDAVLAVNVTGVYLVSQAFLPAMIARQRGSIINMSSCVAEVGLRNRAAYAATKGAILAMTKSMQVDYANEGIRVNALLPGTIATPFVHAYLEATGVDAHEGEALLLRRQLGPELGTAEDVAEAALFLASEASRYVMGSGLVVDGGITAGKDA